MFRFANPQYLYLLLLVPGFIALYFYGRYKRKKELSLLGDFNVMRQLMPAVSLYRPRLKFWLLLTAIIMVIFTIAGPQFGTKLETVKRKGVEVMIALDVSNSMLSQDISPNRLEKSKQILSRLTDKLKDDKIGLIVFAGDAFTQLPITSDYVSAKMFFSSINPNMVPNQGTAIGSAINLAMRSFTPNETTDKTIIVITDGENHEGGAVEAAAAAAEKGVTVNVIGIGSPEGAPIPEPNSSNFFKDNEGNVVITKLNEEMGQQIAAAGKGMYVRADNTNNALNAVAKQIEKMNAVDMESKVYSDYDEQYQVLAWLALVLLVLEFCILEKKNKLFRNIHLFK